MNVGIIGCGLIGQKRARALGPTTPGRSADTRSRARRASRGAASRVRSPWPTRGRARSRRRIDLVVVATTNDALGAVDARGRRAGKHVLVEKPAARSAAELEPVVEAARAGAASSSRSASITASTPRSARRARSGDRRPRPADVHPRPLRPWRPARLETRVARQSRARRRRRNARPGRPPDRPLPLVPRRLRRGRGPRRALLLELAVEDNGFCAAADRRRAESPGCTRAAPSGRTCSPSRSTAATPSSRSTASAAATASSGSRSTRCCPRWARRRRRSGNIPARIASWQAEFADVIVVHSRPAGRVLGGLDDAPPRFASSKSSTSDRPTVARCRTSAMIITRSPLRISLGGGGTDLPSYYREHSGFLIAAAIDKYVYITLHRTFVRRADRQVLEARARANAWTNCSTRSSARRCGSRRCRPRRISRSRAWPTSPPAPASDRRAASRRRCSRRCTRTGKHLVHPEELAEQACQIEIERLGEPIGKQDQYIAAYGGITCFRFLPDGQGGSLAAARSTRRRSTTSKTTCCCSSPATRARRRASCKEQDTKSKRQRQGDDRQPALRQGARPPEQGSARGGRPPSVRRADERALGAQEAAVRRT